MTKRRYDKGERRYKHVSNGTAPTIEFDGTDPKRWVGKCPGTIAATEMTRLLNEAIAASNGDRDLAVPKKLYVVHDGAIYEAQTSDRGMSYHGYPYKGRLSGSVMTKLAAMADAKGCSRSFKEWVKLHIERHGANA